MSRQNQSTPCLPSRSPNIAPLRGGIYARRRAYARWMRRSTPITCGARTRTRLRKDVDRALAPLCDQVTAIDAAPERLARAKAVLACSGALIKPTSSTGGRSAYDFVFFALALSRAA